MLVLSIGCEVRRQEVGLSSFSRSVVECNAFHLFETFELENGIGGKMTPSAFSRIQSRAQNPVEQVDIWFYRISKSHVKSLVYFQTGKPGKRLTENSEDNNKCRVSQPLNKTKAWVRFD